MYRWYFVTTSTSTRPKPIQVHLIRRPLERCLQPHRTMTSPNPLSSLRISRFQIPAYGLIPNTSLQHRPLLIYHSAFPPSATASAIESHLRSVPGGVRPAWRYTMYSRDHFHSTSHEVLCIASGSARVSFGHLDNPRRVEEEVGQGDVVVVPAGVSHRLVRELESPFVMVGSYPEGREWDMCYGEKGEERKIGGISGLGWLGTDPVYGEGGPAVQEGEK